jgi:exopolysaccharide biosynthesis protein
VINVTHIYPGAQVTIKAVSAGPDGGGVASPATLCQQANALACINGDFFNSQGALGGVLVDGKWLRSPTAIQQQLWLDAANRFSIGAQPAHATASLGATRYALLLPGQPISIPEHDGFADGAHARTLVGWNAAGDRFFVTVQQGKGGSGMSLARAADLMRRLGATTAVNEDGGGSSQMVVAGQLRNTPGTSPRAVTNVWAVVARPSPAPPLVPTTSSQWVIRPNQNVGG